MYESGEQLVSKFCQHTDDWKYKNICNDQLKSKSHIRNREKRQVSMSHTHLQTLKHLLTSAEAKCVFIEDFVAMCAESDIPLERIRKLRPFLIKHWKATGSAGRTCKQP